MPSIDLTTCGLVDQIKLFGLLQSTSENSSKRLGAYYVMFCFVLVKYTIILKLMNKLYNFLISYWPSTPMGLYKKKILPYHHNMKDICNKILYDLQVHF